MTIIQNCKAKCYGFDLKYPLQRFLCEGSVGRWWKLQEVGRSESLEDAIQGTLESWPLLLLPGLHEMRTQPLEFPP